MLNFLFLFFSLFLIGCSQKESPKNHFRMNLHSEPSSLDPRMVRDIPTLTCGKMLFEGLVRPGLDGKLNFALAKDLKISEDRRTYEFTLKESYWTNGTPVTASDFEYAWKSALSPLFPSEFSHQLFVIKNAKLAKEGKISLDLVGVHAKNPTKLIVELEYPDPYFLELLSFPITFPICKAVAMKNADWSTRQGDEFICNGPFKLIRWNHGSDLTTQKNSSYWEKNAVLLDQVTLTMIEDEHTELNMYENDELDWAGSPNSSIPPEAIPTLKYQDELTILPIAGTFSYKFNTHAPPFTSKKMRQAFSLAIHRKSLVENILQAHQIVARALLPPCVQGQRNAAQYFQDGDKQNAILLFEQALEENGWTRETMPEITLIFSKSEKHQKVAQAVQQEWSQTFGIKIQLQSYEWNTYLNHLARGDFQVGGKGWIADISDPKCFLEIYALDTEESGWENQAFRELIERARHESDLAKRESLLKEAEEILFQEMPLSPLYHSTACFLKKPYVKDVYISKLCDIDLKRAFIQR